MGGSRSDGRGVEGRRVVKVGMAGGVGVAGGKGPGVFRISGNVGTRRKS